MEKRGWFYRSYHFEHGPFTTEREAIAYGHMHQFRGGSFSTYYGHFFNYQKHKPKN